MKDTNSSAEHSAPKDTSSDPSNSGTAEADPSKSSSASQPDNPPAARRPRIGDSMPAGFSAGPQSRDASSAAGRDASSNSDSKGIDQALANTMAAAQGGSSATDTKSGSGKSDSARSNGSRSGGSRSGGSRSNGSGRSGGQGGSRRDSGQRDSNQRGNNNRRNSNQSGNGQSGNGQSDSGQSDSASPAVRSGSRRPKQTSNRQPVSSRGKGQAGSKTASKSDSQAASKSATDEDTSDDSQSSQTLGRYMMLIHVEDNETHIALLEGRSLVEYYVGHHDKSASHIHGNIYLGQVENVLPGMESAFIDIGTNKNAVLYQGDVVYNSEEFERSSKNPPISQMLKSKQTILCQVIKNPIGQKGARLTQEVSLAGRYVVLLPDQEGISVSKQLSERERKRFRELLQRVKPKGFGVIVRTAVRNAAEKDIEADVKRLLEDWRELSKLRSTAKVPSLLLEEPPLEVQLIREQFDGDFRSVIANDKKTYQRIKDYVKSTAPKLSGRVQFYDESDDSLPLFDRYHVKSQLRKALDVKVWLPSGGSIIIERTEALTVIDVNTGRNLGSDKLSDTIFENNLEAADEIARQLRLRDIGGIIVIDFIDMDYAEQRKKLLRAFKDALRRDKTRVYVSDVSELGLVQMTRKRIGEGLVESFSEICESCEGEGRVMLDLIDGI